MDKILIGVASAAMALAAKWLWDRETRGDTIARAVLERRLAAYDRLGELLFDLSEDLEERIDSAAAGEEPLRDMSEAEWAVRRFVAERRHLLPVALLEAYAGFSDHVAAESGTRLAADDSRAREELRGRILDKLEQIVERMRDSCRVEAADDRLPRMIPDRRARNLPPPEPASAALPGGGTTRAPPPPPPAALPSVRCP